MDVSVVIVNWNTKELLNHCIKSIKNKTSGIHYEIIVIDNNSADGSALMVKKEFPDCTLLESKVNLGFVKGNNRALKEVSGKYVLFLNPDTLIIANTLNSSFRFLEAQNEFGALGCKLISQNNSIQYVCARTFPTPFNQFCELSMVNRLFPRSRFFSSIEMNYWDHMSSREIDCLSGAYIMVRKSLISDLKGFDENIFMYADDVDLCYRIRQEGWRLYYLADEKVIHYEGAGTKKISDTHFSSIMQKESNLYFISKHFGRFKAIQFRLAVCLGSILRLIAIFSILLISKFFEIRKDVSFNTAGKYFVLLLWSFGLRNIPIGKRF